MRDFLKRITRKPVRVGIYGAAGASIPLLIWRGVLPPESAGYILPLLLAVLYLKPDDVD